MKRRGLMPFLALLLVVGCGTGGGGTDADAGKKDVDALADLRRTEVVDVAEVLDSTSPEITEQLEAAVATFRGLLAEEPMAEGSFVADLYVEPLAAGTVLFTADGEEVSVVAEESWLAFVDPDPGRLYSHPVQYVLLPTGGGSPVTLYGQWPLDLGDPPPPAVRVQKPGSWTPFDADRWVANLDAGERDVPPGDYGDAPDGDTLCYGTVNARFPTLAESDGCWTDGTGRLQLGELLSVEVGALDPEDPDGQPNHPDGDLDDGVTWIAYPGTVTVDGKTFRKAVAVVTVRVAADGPSAQYLNLLADLNRDGTWESAGGTELLLSNWELSVAPGTTETVDVPLLLPADGSEAGSFWVRVALTENPLAEEWVGQGELGDGEVEDFVVLADDAAPPPPPPPPPPWEEDVCGVKVGKRALVVAGVDLVGGPPIVMNTAVHVATALDAAGYQVEMVAGKTPTATLDALTQAFKQMKCLDEAVLFFVAHGASAESESGGHMRFAGKNKEEWRLPIASLVATLSGLIPCHGGLLTAGKCETTNTVCRQSILFESCYSGTWSDHFGALGGDNSGRSVLFAADDTPSQSAGGIGIFSAAFVAFAGSKLADDHGDGDGDATPEEAFQLAADILALAKVQQQPMKGMSNPSDCGCDCCGDGTLQTQQKLIHGLLQPVNAPEDCDPLASPTGCLPDESCSGDCECVAGGNGPCSKEKNPSCEPVDCDDNDPNTLFDRCQGDASGCPCKGDKIVFACSDEANPQCNPDDCDDGDPVTLFDRCQKKGDKCVCLGDKPIFACSPENNPACDPIECDDLDPLTVGDKCNKTDKGGCVCGGQVQGPACSAEANPQCNPDKCDDGDDNTLDDKCVKTEGGLCVCKGNALLGVCLEANNPTCQPVDCDDENAETKNDKCVLLTPGGCLCQGEALSFPCGEEDNPTCQPFGCDDGKGTTTADKCVLTEAGECLCQGIDLFASCGDAANPTCEPLQCDDADWDTVEDKCVLTEGGECKCVGVAKTDACGDALNPTCEPLECEDGDILTIGDKCVLTEGGECKCVGNDVADPCGEADNPQCNPYSCDDGDVDTVGDVCKVFMGGCTCMGLVVAGGPCNDLFNPTCEPAKCDDKDGGTLGDVCTVTEAGCECKGQYSYDACAPENNPQCVEKACNDGNDQTEGDVCFLNPYSGACECIGYLPDEGPCGSFFNDLCIALPCSDGDFATENDRCKLTGDGCVCQGELPACSSDKNPMCSPEPCDDGDPDTLGDKCKHVEVAEDLLICTCVGVAEVGGTCSQAENPTCENVPCTDGIDETINDTCVSMDGECKCLGFDPQISCSSLFNPECNAAKCDDFDPLTAGDHCALVEGADGETTCTCVGTAMYPACSDQENPTCQPVSCDDGLQSTTQDRCIVTEKGCECKGKADPCTGVEPAFCTPAPCDDGNAATLKDRCVVLDGEWGPACACAGTHPACAPEANPTCEEKSCDDGDAETTGDHCVLLDGECRCAGAKSGDLCSSEENPQCLPSGCDDGNPLTGEDHCQLGEAGLCGCVGTPVENPCSPDANPSCSPAACDDGNPATWGDKCTPTDDGCLCLGTPVPDPCAAKFNPDCEPWACDDGNAGNGDDVCGKSAFSGSCQCGGGANPFGPCHPANNPQCIDKPCNDFDPTTVEDTCVSTEGGGCECLGTPVNDPCSNVLNPTCEPVACNDFDPTTVGDVCTDAGPDGCLCAGTSPCMMVDGQCQDKCPLGQKCDADCVACEGECIPDCLGKDCGPDGCGGSCGECDDGWECVDGVCNCIPSCEGKVCGDDGCEGSCGECLETESCVDGQCVCEPDCVDKDCGPDGCGDVCGECQQGEDCIDGQCGCLPVCEGKECGPDACGGSCGTCKGGELCNGSGQCVCVDDELEDNDSAGQATPVAGGDYPGLRLCPGDGDFFAIMLGVGDVITVDLAFLHLEGDVDLRLINPNGEVEAESEPTPEGALLEHVIPADGAYTVQVELQDDTGEITGVGYGMNVGHKVCVPDCAGKVCGPDGCGGSCGECDGGWECIDGACVCVPDCADKLCGPDGCGDVCGECGPGEDCIDGQCVCLPVCEGKECGPDACGGSCGTCKDGEVCNGSGQCVCVDDELEDNDSAGQATPVAEGDYPELRLCPGDDDFYAIEVGAGDTITVDLTFLHAEGDVDLRLINPEGGLEAQSEATAAGALLEHVIPADGAYTVQVELQDDTGEVTGVGYGMNVGHKVCVPDCVDKQCGPDGCGGSCGTCDDGWECVDGICNCIPDCNGKECGDDGCEGSCGECPPGNQCDGFLSCVEGGCIQGDPLDCNDGVDCTEDGCDPVTGCYNSPSDAFCDDGDECTEDGCDPATGCYNEPICASETACCITNLAMAECVVAPESECSLMGGNPLSQQACDGLDCYLGACCMGMECMYTLFDMCFFTPGAVFFAGQGCDPNPCL